MSKTAFNEPATVLKGRGVDDTTPLSGFPTWFTVGGIITDDGVISRLKGKLLFRKATSPVIAMHSDQRGNYWIQTSTDLRMYTATDFSSGAEPA